jgi:hypothetical protein
MKASDAAREPEAALDELVKAMAGRDGHSYCQHCLRLRNLKKGRESEGFVDVDTVDTRNRHRQTKER